MKLSAVWLVKASGLKGHREGDAGVSGQHAWVLVNHCNATRRRIFALARVGEALTLAQAIALRPEPVVPGARGTIEI